jgi:hypothetical protein
MLLRTNDRYVIYQDPTGQYNGGHSQYDEYQPYRNLWAAVLGQMFRDSANQGKSVEARRCRRSALHYIYSQETEPRTFIWFCDLFNFSAEYIRDKCKTRAGRREMADILTK